MAANKQFAHARMRRRMVLQPHPHSIQKEVGLGTRLKGEGHLKMAESETLEAFLPDLVTAVCDDVQCITDQCLSCGIISNSRYRRILETKGSEDQARALIQCVQTSTKTDNRCFEIFLDCLDKELPHLVKEKLLPDMRRDLAERASIRKTVIPAAGFPKFQEDDHLQCLQQQSSLFGNSMKKYAHASAEKDLYEQSLQSKTEENGQLQSTQEMLRHQSSTASSGFNSQKLDSAVEKLSACNCEMEMTAFKEKIKKLDVKVNGLKHELRDLKHKVALHDQEKENVLVIQNKTNSVSGRTCSWSTKLKMYLRCLFSRSQQSNYALSKENSSFYNNDIMLEPRARSVTDILFEMLGSSVPEKSISLSEMCCITIGSMLCSCNTVISDSIPAFLCCVCIMLLFIIILWWWLEWTPGIVFKFKGGAQTSLNSKI